MSNTYYIRDRWHWFELIGGWQGDMLKATLYYQLETEKTIWWGHATGKGRMAGKGIWEQLQWPAHHYQGFPESIRSL
jgi:hypothetical protein